MEIACALKGHDSIAGGKQSVATGHSGVRDFDPVRVAVEYDPYRVTQVFHSWSVGDAHGY